MSRRGMWVWAFVMLALSSGLCFVPLFNLLAFEFALAMTPAVTALGFHLAIAEVARLRRAEDHPRARHPLVVERIWLTGVLKGLPLLIVPLLPISLNALRVPNCNPIEGLIAWGLLPGVTLIIACAWGTVAALWSPRWPRVAALTGFVASVLFGLWRLYTTPAVDAFHPFIGYFPGALYDDVIHLGTRLLWSRAHDLAWAAVGLSLAGLLYSPRGVRLSLRADPPARLLFRTPARLIWLYLAGFGLTQVHLHGVRLDLFRPADHVQTRLGGHLQTERFDLYFPAATPLVGADHAWSRARAWTMATELDFYHQELTRFFGRAPERRIAVYVHPGSAVKKRLMGAGRTRIAKPWQWAFHVHDPRVGDTVTLHEMAHVFAGLFADPPFHIAFDQRLLPNMALIEGIAEAATWDGSMLDFHQWSAAMARLDLIPPMSKLLGAEGFYGQSARKVYTLCGSFVRFYRDTWGTEALAEAYRTGDLATAAGEDFATLERRWREHVAAIELSPLALEAARVRFDRPAIFGRICAHEIASIRARARSASARGDLAGALAAEETILGFTPDDPDAQLRRISLLFRLDRTGQAREAASALAAREGAGRVRRARAAEWLADLAARAGEHDQAAGRYTEVLGQAFDRAQARRVAVKSAALEADEAGEAVLRLLTTPGQAGTARARVKAVVDDAPWWPVARYLEARQAVFNGEYETAIRGLEAAVAGGLPHPALTLEARRLVAAAHFRQGAWLDAAAAFEALATSDDLPVERGEATVFAQWARRSRYFAAHAPPLTIKPR